MAAAFQLIDRFFLWLMTGRIAASVSFFPEPDRMARWEWKAIREQSGLTAAQIRPQRHSAKCQRVIGGGLADIVASADQLPQLIATALEGTATGQRIRAGPTQSGS